SDDDEWEDEGRRSPTRSRASTSNHSEIEKRRRDRMNELISQLSALVPAAFKRKLDKLSVLRLTLQHINSISSTGDRELDYSGCAKHLPLHELLFLLEKCIDSFIVVTDLDSGNILYASESVAESTSVAADEIVSRNWFDLLHPDDTQAFKNEMMTFFTESRTSADTGATYRKFF
uniref:BHLH domain-containing protein n=1 Tax=Parascaris univalens TaxID=6257 RepID=A0A915A8W0_PARUN